MDYTVTLKLWFPDGSIRWAARYCHIEAPDESNALLYAKIRLANDTELKDCKVIEARIKEYEEKDSFTFVADKERWELEEENKNAPALIARALYGITDNGGIMQANAKPADNKTGSRCVALLIANLALIAVLLILKIIEG